MTIPKGVAPAGGANGDLACSFKVPPLSANALTASRAASTTYMWVPDGSSPASKSRMPVPLLKAAVLK